MQDPQAQAMNQLVMNTPPDPEIPGTAEDTPHHEDLNIHQEQQVEVDPIISAMADATSNWGNPKLRHHDYKGICTSPKFRIRQRPVDLVDTDTRQQVNIAFCDCHSDNVRLVQTGYMGTTPVHPQTAFSIRLLRTHHVYWKYSAMATQPFALAVDKLLDDHNPLLIVKGTGKPRDWRAPLSVAIDAYRDILKLIRELEFEKLQLDALGKLAANCPRCFGPQVGVTDTSKPDVNLTQDGNFQHKRHAAASVPIPGYAPPVPELFIPPEDVQEMADDLTRLSNTPARNDAEEEVHPCTDAHKATDDNRGQHHFRGFDQTGLFVMGCRHDHALRFIDIVASGEKSYFALTTMKWIFGVLSLRNHSNKVGFLYDIGCNIEKGIIKRNQFSAERASSRLKLGTSVFHAYAHDWGCQLDYNPRLNIGWGLSDGEGSERIWCQLSPLVDVNCHATNEHRQTNISLRGIHHNSILKNVAVSSMTTKRVEVRRRLQEAENSLQRLQLIQPQYTSQYFQDQWERQRALQKTFINEQVQEKRERLKILLRLEENLCKTRFLKKELDSLNATRARTRTLEERRAILALPNTVATIEQKMDDLAQALGTTKFLQLTGSTDLSAKPLLTIQLAKAELYNARVSVVQHQEQSHVRTGTIGFLM
ncbi:hypothetical protein DFH28DRAFT_1157713 [Melampsora americana]|nr:hypothetical protein DFH28DRAFT_1157713 [Melampsora americana]